MNGVFWLPHGCEPPATVRCGEPRWPYVGDVAVDRAPRLIAESIQAGGHFGNPLVLEGDAGVGKTLLARSLAPHMSDEEPTGTLIRAVDWKRAYHQAIDSQTVPDWRLECADAAWVILDDVHHIFDDTAAQRMLESLLDHWIDSGTTVILTLSSRDEHRIGMTPRLESRFDGGYRLSVTNPGPAARAWLLSRLLSESHLPHRGTHHALLMEWWAKRDVTLPRIRATILELAARTPAISLDALTSTLDEIWQAADSQQLSVDTIARLVAARYAVPLREVRGVSRRRSTMRARAAAMWLARKWTPLSYQRIGDYFHNRDHSTVMYACRRFSEQLEEQPASRKLIAAIERQLQEKSFAAPSRGEVVGPASTFEDQCSSVSSV